MMLGENIHLAYPNFSFTIPASPKCQNTRDKATLNPKIYLLCISLFHMILHLCATNFQ
jgi:hypothetical protein